MGLAGRSDAGQSRDLRGGLSQYHEAHPHFRQHTPPSRTPHHRPHATPFAQVLAVFTDSPTDAAVEGPAWQAGTTDPAQTKAPLRLARAGRSISGIHAQPEPGSYARSSPAEVSKLSIGSVKRVISFARASTPNRALALRRGLGDYQVVSSAPPLLLILPTSVLTTQGAAVRVCVSMANAPVDRQRRSPMSNSEPICSDVKLSAITSSAKPVRRSARPDISCQHGCPTPACCIAVATPFELDPRP